MGIFKYLVKAKCYNCGYEFEASIPKGVRVRDYLKAGRARCKNCGCNDVALDIPDNEEVKKYGT